MTLRKLTLVPAIAGLMCAPLQADLIISEYVEGSGNNKALEFLNTGSQTLDLASWELQIYFNGSTSAGLSLKLEGSVAPGANHVLAHIQADPAVLAVADQTTGAGLFNGDDAIVLLSGGVPRDSIGQVGVDPGSYWGSENIRTQDRTLRRRPDALPDTDAADSYDPASAFEGFPLNTFAGLGSGQPGNEPGEPGTEAPVLACGTPATLVSSIQGTGTRSPLEATSVQVEGVVTASFTQQGGFGGFFLQEEPHDQDANPKTSEGLFVYAPEASVAVGDQVRIAGTVVEFNGLTELTDIAAIERCGAGFQVEIAEMALPWASAEAPEAFEGMRVRIQQGLTINDTYDLGRYGSLAVGSGRHFIPTNIVAPGEDAAYVAELNSLDRLILDDGSNRQNPDTIPYPVPGLSAANTLRAGDQVADLTGVLDYRFDEWRLHPMTSPSFTHTNPRTSGPDLERRGNLVVASFNVLNFFNGDGAGGGFPTPRGADSPDELHRQTQKLVSAILAMDADIVGLMEIENDGFGEQSAIAELVVALGPDWAYVDPGLARVGSDAIAVGLIYRADRVTPVADAATLAGPSFEDLNRQPLAQTFVPNGIEDGVTVVVNHLKSKGCGSAEGAEADQGDGQGCWNPARTAAAQSLATWLADDATGSGEKDVLLIGDLNAYAQEDPIRSLVTAGYTDLLKQFIGEQAYSYVYFGQAGYLDHALANTSLASKVADAAVWHISADEPRVLDYNLEFKSPVQQASLYAPGPYRASDHDPVIVALQMVEPKEDSLGDLNGDGRINGRDISALTLALVFRRTSVDRHDINGDGKVNWRDLHAMLVAKSRQRLS